MPMRAHIKQCVGGKHFFYFSTAKKYQKFIVPVKRLRSNREQNLFVFFPRKKFSNVNILIIQDM